MDNENIIVVNDNDECIGSMDKLLVHRNGILHRAFSIMLFDDAGNILIQKRSKYKYHSPSLWANACCSHQRPGELLDESVSRRLHEELGISSIHLQEAFLFRYFCLMPNSLKEHEIDHVYFGKYSGIPAQFNRDEIEQMDYVSLNSLAGTIQGSNTYAHWFKLIIARILQKPELLERIP